MSDYARDGQNANAAIVVQVGPEDFGDGPLDGVRFCERLERQAFFGRRRHVCRACIAH